VVQRLAAVDAELGNLLDVPRPQPGARFSGPHIFDPNSELAEGLCIVDASCLFLEMVRNQKE
jgi:hypothetical protein